MSNIDTAAVNKSLKRGVKEVVKALRKSAIPAANAPITEPIGVVILAADISPMDVISHIPVLCEDHGIPYVFVTSRAELGAAGATKRPTSVVMVTPKSGKKSKKSEDGADEEDFSKVFADLVKLALKEQEKVKVWFSDHVELWAFVYFFLALFLAYCSFWVWHNGKVFYVCHLFPWVISSCSIWSDFDLIFWDLGVFCGVFQEAGIQQNDFLKNEANNPCAKSTSIKVITTNTYSRVYDF